MRIFVYEFVTGGGGLAHQRSSELAALAAEGRAMVRALAADFAALPGVEVVTLRDARLAPLFSAERIQELPVFSADEEERAFGRLAARSTWTVLIAPETGGILRQRAEKVLAAGGRLLSPDAAFIALTTDKHQTALRLAARGVPVPPGQLLTADRLLAGHGPALGGDEAQWPWPMVVKPVDGCGSQGVQLLRDAAAWRAVRPQLAVRGGSWRVERWIEGLAASVSVLCGPGGRCALPACAQQLSDDGRFAYQGGRTPLPAGLDARARRLALRALAALPPTCGYVGVDLVLGADPAGEEDRVIEINPRLTTSYLGLRRALPDNLAGAMLRLALGQPWAWSEAPLDVQFTADGQVRTAADAPCIDGVASAGRPSDP
jgi:predicted ATP-grasp superfamily ATP-dependent carboligase